MITTRPPILWFADMPADFHNPEPFRKMAGLREAGHPVTFVDQLGVANPRPRNARKVARYLARRLRPQARPAPGVPASRQLLVLPPRHHALTDALNDRLLARQLRGLTGAAGAAPILWVRFPTPELVRRIGTLGERLVVYDCVDRYAAFGYPRRATAALMAAERRLLARADLTLTTSEGLRRLAAPWTRRAVLHHTGVDVERFASAGPAPPDVARLPRPRVGFTGSIDEKLDLGLLKRVAERLRGGSVVLIGPRAPGLDTRGLEEAPNVHLLGARPHSAMPAYVRSLDVGLMPYLRSPITDVAFPVKSLEYLAAGIPSVATDLPELCRFSDVMSLAPTGEAFVEGVARAVAGGPEEGADRRRAAAAPFDWSERACILAGLIDEALGAAG